MKVERVSEHIWALKWWMLFPLRMWVVVEPDGVTLVDAGMPFSAKGILRFLEQLNAGPLKRMLLTHGHSDHVGAVKAILAQHSVPVYAHATEIPYLEGDQIYPRRKKAEHNLPKGLTQPLAVTEEGALQSVGSLTPYFAPGHSPGHVVFYHEEDDVLLTGDLFASKKGKLYRPMPLFTGDMAEALRSSRIVKQLNPKRLEACHAKHVLNPAEHWDEYVRTTAAAFSLSDQVLHG